MSEFKFGDIVLIQDFGKGFVMDCGHDGIGPWVEVISKHLRAQLYFRHDCPQYNTSQLTLIARPQAWISLADEYPETMVHVNLCVHEKNPSSKYVITALWVSPNSISADDFCWDGYDTPEDENGDCWTPSGWYEKSNDANDNLCCLVNQDITATHWMPLPEPPKP